MVFGIRRIPDQWKESIIIPIFRKGNKIDCSNFHGISLLSTSYKILSNVLLSRIGSYIYEIIGDQQHGFRPNRSTTDHIFYLHQILRKMGVQ
jgi:sorting nexin-29